MATVAIAIALPRDELRRLRTVLLVTGSLAVLAGATAILVPAVASVAIAVLLGWLLMLAGALMGAYAWAHRDAPGSGRRFAVAALTWVIGLWLVAFPLDGVFTLTVLLTVWFIVSGVLDLTGAWLTGDGWALFTGVLSLVLAGLLLADLPSSAEWAIGLLVGVSLVFWGVRCLMAWWELRQATAA